MTIVHFRVFFLQFSDFQIELDKAVGRISYRDVCIFQAISAGFQRYLQSLPADLRILPVERHIDAQRELIFLSSRQKLANLSAFIDLDKITVKFDQTDIWLLDDFDENSIPLARFSASSKFFVVLLNN